MWQRDNRTWTIEFKSYVSLHPIVWITYIYVVWWRPHTLVKNSYFMQSVLVWFCLKKMPWPYKNFFKKEEKLSSCLRSAYRVYRRLWFCHCNTVPEPIPPPQTTTNTLTLCKLHNAIHCIQNVHTHHHIPGYASGMLGQTFGCQNGFNCCGMCLTIPLIFLEIEA